MNFFDLAVIDFFNQFSQQSWTVDSIIKFIAGNKLFKGGVLLAFFWWGWFREKRCQATVRVHLVSTIFSCILAILLARILALLLPFRVRPIHQEGLEFTLPYSMKLTALEGWSAFPSDHAVLFYALSTGMFYISRRAGILALVYTTLFIAFPRVYLGLHYPSDILAGAMIGIGLVLLCNSNYFIERISQPVLNWSISKPEIFYPVFFILTYQIADMFKNIRFLLEAVKTFFQTIFV